MISLKGTENQLRTLRKQGHGMLEVLRHAFNADPNLPTA
jgi:hypothetical protein